MLPTHIEEIALRLGRHAGSNVIAVWQGLTLKDYAMNHKKSFNKIRLNSFVYKTIVIYTTT